MTVANAKVRTKDSAFQAVSSSMGELLDDASAAYNESSSMLKKCRGQQDSDRNMDVKPKELDVYLDRIKNGAEYIIRTVVAIKQGRGVDQKF